MPITLQGLRFFILSISNPGILTKVARHESQVCRRAGNINRIDKSGRVVGDIGSQNVPDCRASRKLASADYARRLQNRWADNRGRIARITIKLGGPRSWRGEETRERGKTSAEITGRGRFVFSYVRTGERETVEGAQTLRVDTPAGGSMLGGSRRQTRAADRELWRYSLLSRDRARAARSKLLKRFVKHEATWLRTR